MKEPPLTVCYISKNNASISEENITIIDTTSPANLREYLSESIPLIYAPTRLPTPKKNKATATSKSFVNDY